MNQILTLSNIYTFLYHLISSCNLHTLSFSHFFRTKRWFKLKPKFYMNLVMTIFKWVKISTKRINKLKSWYAFSSLFIIWFKQNKKQTPKKKIPFFLFPPFTSWYSHYHLLLLTIIQCYFLSLIPTYYHYYY